MGKDIASLQLESELGFTLPKDYSEFIDQQGYLSLGNISAEIYGYKPSFDKEKLPCAIAATKLCRADYNLMDHDIVISHTGFEDFIIVLDAASGGVFELNVAGNRKKIADSFSSWLEVMQAANNKSKNQRS